MLPGVNYLKYILSILLLLTSITGVNAQIQLQSHLDMGENNVSEGLFLKNTYRSGYRYQQYHLEAGMQFDIISNNSNTLTGCDMIGTREFTMHDFPFDVKGFFMLNRFSDLLYETNWGVRAGTKKPAHFLFEIGTNFKTYAVRSSTRHDYQISKQNSKLRENFNLIYLITGYLKPHNNDWNIGLSFTNIDYYMINQSTNPVFNLQMTCKVKPSLTLYLDAWYKQAGIFNISANYFGYFFRGGVKWEI